MDRGDKGKVAVACGMNAPLCVHIPQSNRAVEGGRGEEGAIGVEAHIGDRLLVVNEGAEKRKGGVLSRQ